MTEEAQAKEKPRATDTPDRDIPRNVEPYYIAFLLKGERWNDTQGAEVADSCLVNWRSYGNRVQAGRYLLAGPITDDGPLVGMSIIAAGNAAEALAIASARSRGAGGTIEGGGAFRISAHVEGLKINYS